MLSQLVHFIFFFVQSDLKKKKRWKMDLENLEHYDIIALFNAVRNKMPRLFETLTDDLLVKILSFLSVHDRLSLIQASHECKDSIERTHMKITDLVAAQLLFDLAYVNVILCLHQISDVVHYLIPSCFQMSSYVFVDWSAFASPYEKEIALIYWSAIPPHARIDINHTRLIDRIRFALSQGCAYLRFSVHVASDQALPDHKMIRLRRRQSRVSVLCDPLHTKSFHMLSSLEWIDPQRLLFKEGVRKRIRAI